MIRLFIALKIDENTQNLFDAIITDFKTKGGKIKWVDVKNMHITLKFLGNTDPKDVDTIITQLQNAIQNFQQIDSNFHSLGGFPNLSKPKVIWTDIENNRNKVIDLAESINESLTDIGIEKNSKPFQPHVTLGRVKSYEDINELTDYLVKYNFENIPITFEKIELIKSTLTQKGPIYKTLHEFSLGERFSG